MLLAGVRDFPAQMGAGLGDVELHRGGEVRRASGSCGCGTTRPGRSTTRWGSGPGTRRPSATTTSGGCRRTTTRSAAPIRGTGTSATGRCSAPARPVASISPNLAGPRGGRVRPCASRCSRRATRRSRTSACSPAQHIFDLADTEPDGEPRHVIPFSFYPETEWRERPRARRGRAVLRGRERRPPGRAAPHRPVVLPAAGRPLGERLHHRPGRRGRHAQPLRRQRARPLRAPRAIGQAGNPAGLETTQAALVADLKKALDGAVAQAATDPFGFGFPWATWDTTSHGAGLSVMASEYDAAHGTGRYAEWSGRWLGNILGANAWGSSFIVGDGTTFPHCLHHQVANLVGSLDGSPPVLGGRRRRGPERHALRGFADRDAELPARRRRRVRAVQRSGSAKFRDNIESFSTVEPAIDLTATSPLAFAWQTVAVPAMAPPPPPGRNRRHDPVRRRRTRTSIDALAILNAHGMHATFYVNSAVDRRRGPHDVAAAAATWPPPVTRSPGTRCTTQPQDAEDGRRSAGGLRGPE